MDTSFGISTSFEVLSPSEGQVAYALLTRLPLASIIASYHFSPFDLHVLSTPPAFVLSQDQTLYKWYLNLTNVSLKSSSMSFALSLTLELRWLQSYALA